jgi:integrase
MASKTTGGMFEGLKFPFTEARLEQARKAVLQGAVETVADGRRSWLDVDCPGLGFRVNKATGSAVFYFQGKVNGQTVRRSLGDADAVRLVEARESVRRLRYDRSVAGALAPRKRDADEPADTTPLVKVVMDDMLAAHAAGRWLPGTRSKVPTDRTMLNYQNIRNAVMRDKVRRKKPGTEDYRLVDGEDFEALTLAAFADRLGDIYGKLQARAPIQANRALQLWRNLYAFAADSKLWDRPNPTIGTGRTDRLTRTVEQPRQRVLTDAEAKRLDAALEADLPLWRDLFRLSLLTLQRMGACCRARWDDITLTGKDAAWRIPAEDMKGRKGGHTVPLADIPDAVELLRARTAAVPKGCPWVFPAAEGDDGHARNYDKAWKRIVKRAQLWTKDRARRPRPHDLRRSGGSRMVEAGVPLNTVTAALGNAASSTPMVAKVYAVVTSAAVKDAFKAVSRRGSRRR